MKKNTETGIASLLLMAVLMLSGCSEKENRNTSGPAETVTDIDGHIYRTVKIGDQVWTAENLKVTRYANGDTIPNFADNTDWENQKNGARCHYGNDATNDSVYGCLYNWYSLNDTRKLTPEGWHVPSETEWQTLVDHLGSDKTAGAKLKETGTLYWRSPNTGATNESGFSALPGGYRDFNGQFVKINAFADFWTCTEYDANLAWFRGLSHDYESVFRFFSNKQAGFSVRLVRD